MVKILDCFGVKNTKELLAQSLFATSFNKTEVSAKAVKSNLWWSTFIDKYSPSCSERDPGSQFPMRFTQKRKVFQSVNSYLPTLESKFCDPLFFPITQKYHVYEFNRWTPNQYPLSSDLQ